MKKIFISAKNKALPYLSFMLASGKMHAASTQLGKGIENASSSILKEIAAIYCGSLWLLLLAINAVWLAITKNDRLAPILWKTLIGIIAAYIFLKLIVVKDNSITGTVDTLSDWIK